MLLWIENRYYRSFSCKQVEISSWNALGFGLFHATELKIRQLFCQKCDLNFSVRDITDGYWFCHSKDIFFSFPLLQTFVFSMLSTSSMALNNLVDHVCGRFYQLYECPHFPMLERSSHKMYQAITDYIFLDISSTGLSLQDFLLFGKSKSTPIQESNSSRNSNSVRGMITVIMLIRNMLI
jgi:hypothetical protein